MVKNSANAGDTWSGKIPRTVEQLSPCDMTIEPVLLSPCAVVT